MDMNLVKHNLFQRRLAEYKSGLLSLLGRIMGRGKVYTSRGEETVTTMGSEDYIKHKMVSSAKYGNQDYQNIKIQQA